MSPATAPHTFWSPTGSWEIVLLAVGGLLTLAVLAFFIIVMVRAGREGRTNDE